MNRFTKISSTDKDLADTAKKWVAVRDNNSGLIWAADSILTTKAINHEPRRA